MANDSTVNLGSSNLSIEDEQRLVDLLEAFEAELRGGRKPSVEAWLDRVEPHVRSTLARDLRRLVAEFENGAVAVQPETRAPINVSSIQASMLAETAELLRIRLRAAAIIICAAVGLFFIRSLLFPDWEPKLVRAIAIAIAAVIAWRLRPSATCTLRLLRGLEITLLAVVGVHTIALQAAEMLQAAETTSNSQQIDAAVGVNAAMLFAFTAWCVINMAYGMLIPNNWRRATAILLTTAAIPFLVSYAVEWVAPSLVGTVREELRYAGGLLTLVASGTAIGGAYTMNHLRMELFRAKRFGRYRLVKRLGRGGMGEVYLAEHQLLKRPSAIKLIRPGFDSNEEAIRRFEREVQATAALAHWNTVEIFDYGRTDDGAFYYVMEYLDGLSLQQLVEQHGPLPPGRVVFFLSQLCSALVESHAAGLIHRDIKPANVFAARCGSQHDVAKLLDFGLVHEQFAVNEPSESQSATRFVGTPRFLSPEQATRDATVDPRSDIYSLGATAYFLLTGKPPFDYKNPRQCIHAHLEENPAPPSKFDETIESDLDAVVLRCLAKRPADRFASAAELSLALAACTCAGDWNGERAEQWWRERQPNSP